MYDSVIEVVAEEWDSDLAIKLRVMTMRFHICSHLGSTKEPFESTLVTKETVPDLFNSL